MALLGRTKDDDKRLEPGLLLRRSHTFCDAQEDDLISAPFLDVIGYISECLAREYDTAENCLPYESAEGGYQGTVWTTYELLIDQLELELPNDHEDRLLDAIADALGDRAWCDAHPFILADSDRLRMSWAEFCEIIESDPISLDTELA